MPRTVSFTLDGRAILRNIAVLGLAMLAGIGISQTFLNPMPVYDNQNYGEPMAVAVSEPDNPCAVRSPLDLYEEDVQILPPKPAPTPPDMTGWLDGRDTP